MDKFRAASGFFLLFLILSLLTPSAVGERRDVERAIGVTATKGAWERVRSWARLGNLRPPDSWSGNWGSSAGERVKEAFTKSFGTGKEAAEQAAKSAAHATDEAVQKVKRTVSSKTGGDRPVEDL